MLLRKISKHVTEQNWFAVALDFVIVVVGVFIGMQVANWNESRVEFQNETDALIELKKELSESISITSARSETYRQTADAGKRGLAYLEKETDCAKNCWDLIVDFMHASQWQDLTTDQSSYENMRTQGFPKSTKIIDAVKDYQNQQRNNAAAFVTLPDYRSIVRQVINIKAQEYYWEHCWSIVDGQELYVLDCPSGLPADEAKLLINEIRQNSSIKGHLTEWVGAVVSLPTTLGDQNIAAQETISLIDQELESR
jgi:hypothetical protein